MGELLMYALSLVPLLALGVVIPPLAGRRMEARKTLPQQGVVKRDWLPTGRIDFATQINADVNGSEQPSQFKLLVEEHRIVESVAGNENLEIQWRLATLKEAKAVLTQYHKYLSENSLIRSVNDDLPQVTFQSSSDFPTPRVLPAPG